MKGFSVITVTQLNRYIKSVLEEQPALRELYVKGELSNFSANYASGHFYFTLKDETAAVRAVMFRSHAETVPFVPQNGMKVIARCTAALYERDGQFQLSVYDLQPDGLGAVYLAIQQLKEKLTAQGLFDTDRKKALPAFPNRVGIVTSPKAAAYHDMLTVLQRRWPLAQVMLAPTPVQGKGAAKAMAAALTALDTAGGCDVIIIGRGGGSVEDLWEFNDESLALAVGACNTPVISAVGHETDYTLCDLAADLRAPTPSAAAELAVPDQAQLGTKLTILSEQLQRSVNIQLTLYNQRFLQVNHKIYANSPEKTLQQNGQTLLTLVELLTRNVALSVERHGQTVERLRQSLSALNPLEILSRGYAIAKTGEGGVITSVDQVSTDDSITITLADGVIHSVVTGQDRRQP